MSESTQQLPPMPAAQPGVFTTPVPVDAPPPAVGQRPAELVNLTKEAPASADPTRTQQIIAQTRRGTVAGMAQVRAWAYLEGLDEEEMGREVRRHRAKEASTARREHQNRVKAVQRKLTEAAGQGHSHKAERYEQSLTSLMSAGPTVVYDEEVTEHDIAQHRRAKVVARCAAVVGGVVGGGMVGLQHPLLLLVALLGGGVAAWHHGRERDEEATSETAADAEPQLQMVAEAPSPYGGTTVETPMFDAPPPPALSEEALNDALRNIRIPGWKPDSSVKILAAPSWGEDQTAITVFDLPPGITVKTLKEKQEDLAAALGRDSTMIDVSKAGAAGRCSLWMSDEDPFERPRPSPLLMRKGGVDAWSDGVPVAWGKRGNTIALPIYNQNTAVAGMTRSGKGVGAANLAVGSSLDVRINLRIVAGKNNGEWDPYAKAGVAATYFKPNPERLLALLKAELADKDRREAELGELGKSKLVTEAIQPIGGIELIIIDELATYTRPGKPLRDEILEALIELSAVAAGAGILLLLITQYPEVDVVPQGLMMNCGTRWAMRVDNAQQSNAILGGGASGSGRDASKFDPPRPGLGWLTNPFASVTDLARSFDLDEDERGEVTKILARAADLRNAAGRLPGQWDDPIEKALIGATGLSSASGGPDRNGVPAKAVTELTAYQRQQMEACRGALISMTTLERDVAQLDEMADIIGGSMTGERLGELLRAAGAGGTTKVTIPGRGRVNGYRREDIADALKFLEGA